MHTGDVFAFKTFPIVDANNGGSSTEYANTIAKAAAAMTDLHTVVTGHYPRLLPMRDLARYGEFVREFVEGVRAAKSAGQTMKTFAETWKVPERFLNEGYLDTRPYPDAVWNDVK